jgi:hypothetical protein
LSKFVLLICIVLFYIRNERMKIPFVSFHFNNFSFFLCVLLLFLLFYILYQNFFFFLITLFAISCVSVIAWYLCIYVYFTLWIHFIVILFNNEYHRRESSSYSLVAVDIALKWKLKLKSDWEGRNKWRCIQLSSCSNLYFNFFLSDIFIMKTFNEK